MKNLPIIKTGMPHCQMEVLYRVFLLEKGKMSYLSKIHIDRGREFLPSFRDGENPKNPQPIGSFGSKAGATRAGKSATRKTFYVRECFRMLVRYKTNVWVVNWREVAHNDYRIEQEDA